MRNGIAVEIPARRQTVKIGCIINFGCGLKESGIKIFLIFPPTAFKLFTQFPDDPKYPPMCMQVCTEMCLCETGFYRSMNGTCVSSCFIDDMVDLEDLRKLPESLGL